MRSTLAVATLASVLSVYATDIAVTVGANDALVFSPSSVTANVGDNVVFTFASKNHSATQSTFAAPCTKSGVDSGFQDVAALAAGAPSPTFNFTVNVTTPLWFYCAQTNPASHCAAGMVFAINANANKSFTAFQAAANATGSSSSGSSAKSSAGSGSNTASAPGSSTTAKGNAGERVRVGGALAFIGLVAAMLL